MGRAQIHKQLLTLPCCCSCFRFRRARYSGLVAFHQKPAARHAARPSLLLRKLTHLLLTENNDDNGDDEGDVRRAFRGRVDGNQLSLSWEVGLSDLDWTFFGVLMI